MTGHTEGEDACGQQNSEVSRQRAQLNVDFGAHGSEEDFGVSALLSSKPVRCNFMSSASTPHNWQAVAAVSFRNPPHIWQMLQRDNGHVPAVAEEEEELDPEWRKQGLICQLRQIQVNISSWHNHQSVVLGQYQAWLSMTYWCRET